VGGEGAFFLYQSNVHTFNCHHRKARACLLLQATYRRVKGLVAEGWVGRGMDTNIYIACLQQVVAFGFCIRSQGNYYCLPPAGVLHSQNKVIKCAAYGVAQGRG
jgi:hypothetical protein